MVEQPQRGMRKCHPMLVRGLDTLFVHNTPTRSRQILDPTLPRPMHVIRERKERITRARHPIQLGRPLLLLLRTQRLYTALEETLPLRLLPTLQYFSTDEEVNGVGLLGALDALFEGERENARVVAEPPEIGFPPCQTGAVDPGLLTRTETDDRSMQSVSNTVRLRVLKRQSRKDQICDRPGGDL